MSAQIQRIEVITRTEKRRRWSAEEKQAIVAESIAGAASITAVARRHGIGTGQLHVDVAIELVEARLAVDLGPTRAEQPPECAIRSLSLGHVATSLGDRGSCPCSARYVRSFRRASCNVL